MFPGPDLVAGSGWGRDHQQVKVLLTGGTGYVGSHCAEALAGAGHEIRLLVRRPDQVPLTFDPHGWEPLDVVVGDVLDAEAVGRAIKGCDAVVHAAAVFSFDPRDTERLLNTNEQAARTVLTAAVEAGCDPVVHISSTVALTRRGGGTGPDLPLGDVDAPYSRSKIASERVARELQDGGAPVVTVYPGSVFGPHDPYVGEQQLVLSWVVRGRLPAWPTGSLHACDVRDVAAVVTAAMRPGRGPRRYVVPGHAMTGRTLYGAASAAIGRRRPHLPMPTGPAAVIMRMIDPVQRRLPARWRVPNDPEGIELSGCDTRFDTSAVTEELGVTPRPFAESIRDTVAWMVDAGHLKEKYRPT